MLQIERNTFLIEFSQSAIGKLANLAIFAVPLAFLLPQWWLGILASLTLITFFPAQRFPIFFLCNFSFWIFSDYLRWRNLKPIFLASNVDITLLGSFGFRTAAIVASLTFFALLIHLLTSRALKNHQFFVFYGTFFGLIYLAADFLPKGWLYACIWTILFLCGRFFWFLLYAIKDFSESRKGLAANLLAMTPFWSAASILPIPGGLESTKAAEARSEELAAVVRLKSIKMIYLVAIWFAALMISSRFLVGGQHLTIPVGGEAFSAWLQKIPSIDILSRADCANCSALEFMSYDNVVPATNFKDYFLRLFGGLFYFSANFLLILLIWNGTSVAVCRMAGFHIKRSIYRPFEAKSFAYFFARWNQYYRQIITDLLFIPIYSSLRFLRNGTFRVFAAIGLAILTCGLTHHFIVRVMLMHLREQNDFVGMILNTAYLVPYFMAFITVVTLSEYFKPFRQREIHGAFRILAYISIYFAAYLMSFSIGPDFSLQKSMSTLSNLLLPTFLFQ